MQVELTIRRGDTCVDVAVTAPGPVPLAAVTPALGAALGCDAPLDLWHEGRRLRTDARLGSPGLRNGTLVDAGGPGARRTAAGVLSLHRVGGPDAGSSAAVARGRVVLGRDPACDVVLDDADASRRHAVVEIAGSTMRVLDTGSTNGTTVDGHPVPSGGVALAPGQVVRIGDTSLAIRGPVDVPAELADTGNGVRRLIRPPRDVPVVARREITVPERASAARPRGVQWIAALLPAVAGAGLAWLAHAPQFLLFALLSPLMLISTAMGDRLHWRRSRRRDAATYAQRRAQADQQIADGLALERRVRARAAPDAAATLSAVTLPGTRLWERRRADADLLDLRLGLGTLPAACQVRDGAGVRSAGLLVDVPCSVSLRDGPLGVCGPPDVVDAVLRHLAGQLAARHSPADIALTFLLGPRSTSRWHWARWLPHLAGRVATTPDEWAAHAARLADDRDQRSTSRRGDGAWSGAWHVVVLDRAADLPDVPGLSALLSDGWRDGITALCVAEHEQSLPSACRTVVRVRGATGTRAVLRRSHAAGALPRAIDDVVLDTVGEAWAQRLARGLAAITDPGADGAGALPAVYPLAEALRMPEPTAAAVAARWATCAGGAATVLGAGADGPLVFDLVRDGPHALIAGTTGAGKSELLQSLVAGLAANHPPETMSFLLVDYKGGAAFADCARLPHTAGLVTDLDAYLTARALRSLHSELRRRERLFAERGAADLAAYRATSPVEPLPRLIIVVDEFAALTQELPDFVHGLIGVAQRGRSLGVHLVLATQRPRSAVSGEIRANTALRVALRVIDTAESMDVIDCGDAAGIGHRDPGRGYLRCGDAVTVFQAAYGGGPMTRGAPVSVQVLDEWRRPHRPVSAPDGPTQLAAVVDAVRAATEDTGRRPVRAPWLAPLPDALPLDALPAPANPWSARIAVVDLPDEQRRAQVELDLRRGQSLLVVGAPRSGRTTALATVALDAAHGLSPDELQLYAVDPGGPLGDAIAGLPHLGTLVGRGDVTAALTLLRRLAQRCGQDEPAEAPHQLLLLDSWDSFTASLDDADAADAADLLAVLLRDGPASRLTIVAAGGRGCLLPRFAGNFGARIVLALADRNDYGLAGIAPRDVPTSLPAGRGIRAQDGAAVHIAHGGARPGLDAARAAVVAVAQRWPARASAASTAIRVRALPQRVALRDLADTLAPVSAGAPAFILGVGGDAADPVLIRPFAGAAQTVVAGPPRSGRSTTLVLLLAQAAARTSRVVVAASTRSPLHAAAVAGGVPVVEPHGDPAPLEGPEPALLLVDDCELFVETAIGEALLAWVRQPHGAPAVVVAGRADELATSYRGLGAHVRRACCGLLLRPGPVDGEILGARLPRRARTGPAGRGVLIGDPAWGAMFTGAEPVPVQVATPDALHTQARA